MTDKFDITDIDDVTEAAADLRVNVDLRDEYVKDSENYESSFFTKLNSKVFGLHEQTSKGFSEAASGMEEVVIISSSALNMGVVTHNLNTDLYNKSRGKVTIEEALDHFDLKLNEKGEVVRDPDMDTLADGSKAQYPTDLPRTDIGTPDTGIEK